MPQGLQNVGITCQLFAIGQKVRLGKWPEMEPFLSRLIGLADEQGGRLLETSAEASLLAATLEWAHRDPSGTVRRGDGNHVVADADLGRYRIRRFGVRASWPGRLW